MTACIQSSFGTRPSIGKDFETFNTFKSFPRLPIELRLNIWDYAAEALTGGSRVIEIFWIDPGSMCTWRLRRPEDGARLLLVNRESRDQYMRSHRLVPRLTYQPPQVGKPEPQEDYFTYPQYINPRIDTLFVADTSALRSAVLLDRLSEIRSLEALKLEKPALKKSKVERLNSEDLRFLACRVESGLLVYNIPSLAKFPNLQLVTLSVADSQFKDRRRGGKVSFVKSDKSLSLTGHQNIVIILQALFKTSSDTTERKLPPFQVKEVVRGAVLDNATDLWSWSERAC